MIDSWQRLYECVSVLAVCVHSLTKAKSYLMLTWCCALNLIMIITIITNTDNIFQSDTATLMNQSKMEYIWGHFHQRLMGRSFCGNLSKSFLTLFTPHPISACFSNNLQVMKSDLYVPTVTSTSKAVAIVMTWPRQTTLKFNMTVYQF